MQPGFEFYREYQFTHDGRSLWRFPGASPADIHHHRQGILSAERYHRYSKSRRADVLSNLAPDYTLKHFQDSRGAFYYRKHRYFTDRTTYMRWGNAWMFLAMAEVLRDL